jgi:Bacterial conjugation TrbI-like protein
MTVSDNGDRNGTNNKKPVDHLRAFVASVMEPRRKNGDDLPAEEGEQAQMQPFRGRDAIQGNGEDKTAKFIIAGVAGVVVLVLLILGFSQEHSARKRQGDTPNIGQVQTSINGANPSNSGIVPRASMQPTPLAKKGKLTAQDLEDTVAQASNGPSQIKPVKTLGQIAPFDDTWAPKPYNGQQEQTDAQQEKAESAALAQPSLVFVANTSETATSSRASTPLTPSLDLGTGARLSAHLASVVTTAVDDPVIAVIEYSYERDGEIVVPAGTKAVGHVQQADRSGYVSIKFDQLEMPHHTVLPIDALATDRNLGPLKGKVTGTHRGRNFLVRSFTDIGPGLAMFAGQNNTSGAFSEDDLLRARLAQNVGNAGDQEITQLRLTEHPIVTIPAGTDIYVVFEKTSNKRSNGSAIEPARPTQQSLNELRELLELQRETNQSHSAESASNP